MKESLFYRPLQGDVMHCFLCPKECRIGPGKRGACRVRENRGGKLWSLNYGECSSYALDPIEKKPLYHFYPGKAVLSVGTFGCNFTCSFCQNWQIAQKEPKTSPLSPKELVEAADKLQIKGNMGIAYTYSEPTVWYEFVYETARLAKERNLKNILVTNGFIGREPLEELLPYIDALNIDVKGYTEEFYHALCGGKLSCVQRTVEIAAQAAHVEVTTLLIPGQNDRDEEITALAKWLGEIRKDIPLHFSRYFPNYKLSLAPTPLKTMERARELAREHLYYVYLGNVQGDGNNTYCYVCGTTVIDRQRRQINLTSDRRCPKCQAEIHVVM